MAVTVNYPLQFPDNSPALPVEYSPEQYNPYAQAGYLRPWYIGGTAVPANGDGSGGGVYQTWDFRASGNDTPVFITIVRLKVETSNIVAGLDAQCYTTVAADWDRPFATKVKIDNQVETMIPSDMITPSNPYAMGEGVANSTLSMTMAWSNNTSSKQYYITASGWISDRPFLTPTTFIP